jgi:hypothetical protein
VLRVDNIVCAVSGYLSVDSGIQFAGWRVHEDIAHAVPIP